MINRILTGVFETQNMPSPLKTRVGKSEY